MIEIKRITEIADYRRIPEIQQSAWGFSDRDVEPHQLMTRVQKYGGLVQGLFLDGEMAGFTYGLIGRWEGRYFIYSHMAAVRKERQGRGLGFLLKKAQREEVLRMGYDRIRWNFDPLEALNSFFNLHRLGVICHAYERNIYGEGESGLHRGMPTDRLIAEWELNSPRVAERLAHPAPARRIDVPEGQISDFSASTAYIEIPRDIRRLKETDLPGAQDWRRHTREWFETSFARGYRAGEIVFSADGQRIFYQLNR